MTDKNWMINWLEIQNFKSIKSQKINCKRLNIFIGKPNVGKSNILEALALLGGYNCNKQEKVFSEIVRYENYYNLFYDNDRNLKIEINSNIGYFLSKFNVADVDGYDILYTSSQDFKNKTSEDNDIPNEILKKVNHFKSETLLDEIIYETQTPTVYFTVNSRNQFNIRPNLGTELWGNIKKYDFVKNTESTSNVSNFLSPPNGNNWVKMLEVNPKIFEEIADIFDSYGLQALIDQESNKLEILKVINRRAYKIPYSMCADTLQRYIFNLLAIKTNKNSVIILEEPEAHSFPTYISDVANEIVEDKNNQYFIATHSPYLLREVIEKTQPEELAIFICGYNDYQTTVRELTQEEISNILENDVDLFYNLRAFQND